MPIFPEQRAAASLGATGRLPGGRGEPRTRWQDAWRPPAALLVSGDPCQPGDHHAHQQGASSGFRIVPPALTVSGDTLGGTPRSRRACQPSRVPGFFLHVCVTVWSAGGGICAIEPQLGARVRGVLLSRPWFSSDLVCHLVPRRLSFQCLLEVLSSSFRLVSCKIKQVLLSPRLVLF